MVHDPAAALVCLSRERIIALTGSSARLDYKPAITDPGDNYPHGEERRELTKQLNEHMPLMVALHMCGLSTHCIGVACGANRVTIDRRFRLLGLGYPGRNGPAPTAEKIVLRRPFVCRVRS